MKYTPYILSLALLIWCIPLEAQKLKIGTYTFKDGAVYQGELEGGRPSGKGRI